MPEQRRTGSSPPSKGEPSKDEPSKGERARGTSADAGRGTVAQVGPEKAARTARDWLEGFIVHRVEGVCAVRRTEDGWCVAVDVLEVPRIPDTTSLLATYEVVLDDAGRPAEYRRVCRYHRGAVHN
ncbi:gas vesicle protein GvpO [Streptomyces djakartensis]|uniref:Gas vesicle protein n=1 Tax=Streptomyces djakartensis TaxID=68193 RepID=A0ABQ3ADQ6_9ACTN|nr:gas vesicle protein [Streptomyces djakartensis]GGY44749.1 gas vesicle protein [Streptomyces djakartensis]